jgi:hypothetical protein
MIKDPTIRRWWPTTQSLDLVEAPLDKVAYAVHAEYSRFTKGEHLETGWHRFQDLEAAFLAAGYFENIPTFMLVLPTRSKWTVLWNNSFLCDGYDSLCWNLSRSYGLTTIHWSAHDEVTTFQPSAQFTHRKHDGVGLVERYVYCAREDKKVLFGMNGKPLPEENIDGYLAKRTRDRMNERVMLELLHRLDARPWSENFYALPEQECYSIRRSSPPGSVSRRSPNEVLRPLSNT